MKQINDLTQVEQIKNEMSHELAKELNITKIPAPLFLELNDGLNDLLNGVETPVLFQIESINKGAEIIHSLAKWKRIILTNYELGSYDGIYCDMKAIRKSEEPDATHSLLVDQWDWEVKINQSHRTVETLKKYASKVYKSIINTSKKFNKELDLGNELFFISSQELENMYPNLSAKERENEITKMHKAVFIIGIGHKLNSGKEHDFRSPEYDDWNLNGDLLFWSPSLNQALEISSMGIRVDSEALKQQISLSKNIPLDTKYQKMIINNELSFTIGGGIGQSRLCMLILNLDHIGKVQFSIWKDYDNLLK